MLQKNRDATPESLGGVPKSSPIIETFSKDTRVQRSRALKNAGLYPFFRPIESSDGSTVMYGNKRQVMIGSNNYLGLTHHPYVKEETLKAIQQYGTGCTGSRFLNGTLAIHEELEELLARHFGFEETLVFSTGMQVNLGCISSLAGPRDCIISDMENHASIVDATRLSMAPTFKFKHNDMQELEALLEKTSDRYRHTLIVFDGVFSMTGELINLPEVIRLARKYGAYVYLDDAHGAGVMGPLGSGTGNHFGLNHEVDFYMGTFSKSFSSVGGFFGGSRETVEYVKHTSRSFMFSAAAPPSAVATVKACLEVINREPEVFDRLWSNVNFMRKGLTELGFYTYGSQTPIIPILAGDDQLSLEVTRFLEESGVFATPVLAPAVPKGEAMIRTSYMASHRREDLQYCLDVFEQVAKKFKLPTQKNYQ